MSVSGQVVDIGADPLDERRRRRRAALRIGIPIGGVVLMIATILGIALYADRANRDGALALSNDLLATLENRIELAVSAYLDPPARAVRIARDTVRNNPVGDRIGMVEGFAASLLREIPQIDNLSFADGDGNYTMFRRGGAGGLDIKLIRNAPGPRSVVWLHHDAAGKEIGREETPDDDYDPRTRPWYMGALATDDLFWTGVYVFFTSRQPGITVAARYPLAEGRPYVFGADITLDALSKFLSTLEIGKSGRAVIIDDTGHLIAAPVGREMLRETKGELATARVDELSDTALTHAYDRFRVDGYGRRVIEVDGQRYISAVAPLKSGGRDWSLMIVVPENDFVGFVASSSRKALAMSLVIVVVAALLALLLMRQGLRADRGARLLLERQQAISRQSAAFAALASDPSLTDPTRREPPRGLTETLADVTGARRASLWRLTSGGRTLRCEDSFDHDTGGHIDGLELHRDELPQFFAQILTGGEMEIADAANDRRTSELHRVMMAPLGTHALLAVPVRRETQVVGVIWLEDAPHAADSRDFVRASANMVALRLAEASAAAVVGEPARAAVTAAAIRDGTRSFSAELRSRDIDAATIEAEVYSGVAVMALHFTDTMALAARRSAEERCLSHEIACGLQEIATRHNIPYLKIVGHAVVAAAGFAAGDTTAAAQIADVALAVRDHCIALFEETDRPQGFRIGIDCGVAIGSVVGSEPRVFNLWGDAVQTASAMADSALPGTVQATEAAYHRLRQDFLFRPRGSFYLPRVGAAQTFVLAARL